MLRTNRFGDDGSKEVLRPPQNVSGEHRLATLADDNLFVDEIEQFCVAAAGVTRIGPVLGSAVADSVRVEFTVWQ